MKICTGGVRGTDCGPVKIEGLFAELDAPDEFYFDKATSKLFLFYNNSHNGSSGGGGSDGSVGGEGALFGSNGGEDGAAQCTAASCTACACGACNSCACGDFCYAYCQKPGQNCACPACNGPNPSPPTPVSPAPPPAPCLLGSLPPCLLACLPACLLASLQHSQEQQAGLSELFGRDVFFRIAGPAQETRGAPIDAHASGPTPPAGE